VLYGRTRTLNSSTSATKGKFPQKICSSATWSSLRTTIEWLLFSGSRWLCRRSRNSYGTFGSVRGSLSWAQRSGCGQSLSTRSAQTASHTSTPLRTAVTGIIINCFTCTNTHPGKGQGPSNRPLLRSVRAGANPPIHRTLGPPPRSVSSTPASSRSWRSLEGSQRKRSYKKGRHMFGGSLSLFVLQCACTLRSQRQISAGSHVAQPHVNALIIYEHYFNSKIEQILF